MRETENLEFIAVGPWGVPSPCVRTSGVYCVGKPCVWATIYGPFFVQPHPQTPTTPTAVCRAQTTLCAQDLPHESHVLQYTVTLYCTVRLHLHKYPSLLISSSRAAVHTPF